MNVIPIFVPVSLICMAAHPVWLALAVSGDQGGVLLAGYGAALALHAVAALWTGLPVWLALLVPGYCLLHRAALMIALSDLVRDLMHWRKTEHGAAVWRQTA